MQHQAQPRRRRALQAALLSCLVATAACATDEPGADEQERARIEFAESIPAFTSVEVDSGPVEVAEGVTMRTVTTFDTSFDLEAAGIVRGERVDPIDDTGAISAHGQVEVQVFATVTLPGYEFDGLAGTQTFEVDTEISRFDPFLIDDPRILGLDIPSEYEVRIDPKGGLGLAFIVELSLGLYPTYEGTCLQVDDATQSAQYTMRLQPVGDLKYLYGVELVTPLGSSPRGSIGVDLDFSELGTEVDMGTYSLDDGQPVDAKPCG